MNSVEWGKLERACGHLTSGTRPATRERYQQALRRLRRFNEERGIVSWKEWDGQTAIGFIEWMEKGKRKAGSVRDEASTVFRTLSALKALEPEVMHPDFFAPRAYLPQVETTFRDDKGLRPDVLKAMLRACFSEIDNTKAVGSLRALVPFAVAIAIRTGMNAGSLYSLRRDCLTPVDEGYNLVWDKPRSGGELRQWHAVEPLGVVEIVRKLQVLTAGATLFSAPSRGEWRSVSSFEPALSEFRRDYGFPPFALSDLRSAVATLIFELEDGAVTKVQRFLGHRGVNTTLRYLHEWAVRPQQARALRTAHARACARWGFKGKEPGL